MTARPYPYKSTRYQFPYALERDSGECVECVIDVVVAPADWTCGILRHYIEEWECDDEEFRQLVERDPDRMEREFWRWVGE